MREFWKKHKGEIVVGLIVTIFGGLILAALLSQQFRNLAIKGLDAIQIKVPVPLYWLLTMFALGVVVTRLLTWKASKKTNKYGFDDMDEVHGLVWEWFSFRPDVLKPVCPKCFTELWPNNKQEKCEYHCVSCGFKKIFEVDHGTLLGLVKLELEKRKRTGEDKHAKDRINTIKRRL